MSSGGIYFVFWNFTSKWISRVGKKNVTPSFLIKTTFGYIILICQNVCHISIYKIMSLQINKQYCQIWQVSWSCHAWETVIAQNWLSPKLWRALHVAKAIQNKRYINTSFDILNEWKKTFKNLSKSLDVCSHHREDGLN